MEQRDLTANIYGYLDVGDFRFDKVFLRLLKLFLLVHAVHIVYPTYTPPWIILSICPGRYRNLFFFLLGIRGTPPCFTILLPEYIVPRHHQPR